MQLLFTYRLLPHHHNVRTTTVVVVVVHTPHSIPKNDRTRSVIRTSKCTVQLMTNQKKFKKFFLKNFFGGKWTFEQCGCELNGSVRVWTTTTLKC